MGPLNIIRIVVGLLYLWASAKGLQMWHPDQPTFQENHNWNTTCIGIMTIATIVIIGLFGSFQVVSEGNAEGKTASSVESVIPESTTSEPMHLKALDHVGEDNSQESGTGTTLPHSADKGSLEEFGAAVTDWFKGLFPAVISTLATWAVGAYLGCMLSGIQTIFTDFPTRDAKIKSARFSSQLLLTEAGFVGIIAILTIIGAYAVNTTF